MAVNREIEQRAVEHPENCWKGDSLGQPPTNLKIGKFPRCDCTYMKVRGGIEKPFPHMAWELGIIRSDPDENVGVEQQPDQASGPNFR